MSAKAGQEVVAEAEAAVEAAAGAVLFRRSVNHARGARFKPGPVSRIVIRKPNFAALRLAASPPPTSSPKPPYTRTISARG